MADQQTPVRYPVFCPTLPDPEDLLEGMRNAFTSGRVTAGEHVKALEADVCERLGVGHTIAVSSGTSGLMLLIRALNLPSGSEVITPSFTFAATSHALLWNGLRPVFCDSEPDSFTMDASAAEALINSNTSAIYPVCIFGVPGDLDSYQRLADRYGLALIFDSAQGVGSTYQGRAVGNFGVGEVFSMSPTKIVTAMEGGLVTTNDDQLAGKLRRMRDYGKAPDGEDMQWLGLSARMPEMNAMVGRWSLARLDTWVTSRTAIMDRYEDRLKDLPGVSFQKIPSRCTSSRNYIVILLDPQISPITRDELYRELRSEGIQTKRYFHPALHNQSLYCDLDPGCSKRLPVVEMISSRSLALPMYSHMPMEAVQHICDSVEACFDRASSVSADHDCVSV